MVETKRATSDLPQEVIDEVGDSYEMTKISMDKRVVTAEEQNAADDH